MSKPPRGDAVDLSRFRSQLSWGNRLRRAVWGVVWLVLFRPSPRLAFAWRRVLLRLFGARVGRGVRVYPSARIFDPARLELGDQAILGPAVDCYCVDRIAIGANAMVSQYSYLCSASHDYREPHLPLVTAPIEIGPASWICADCFVGPGVSIGEGSVIGARSTVLRSVPPWVVAAGHPARVLKPRVLRGAAEE